MEGVGNCFVSRNVSDVASDAQTYPDKQADAKVNRK